MSSLAEAWSRSFSIALVRLQPLRVRARRYGMQMATAIAAAILVSVALGCLFGRMLGEEAGVSVGVAMGMWCVMTGGAPWPRSFSEPK
jgi:hypothetical protein